MAPSVALLAILVADTENTDHPYNRKLKAKIYLNKSIFTYL
jgi:hypothetical protein